MTGGTTTGGSRSGSMRSGTGGSRSGSMRSGTGGSRSGTTRRCPDRVNDLIRDGCDLACVGRDEDDCPICMDACTGA